MRLTRIFFLALTSDAIRKTFADETSAVPGTGSSHVTRLRGTGRDMFTSIAVEARFIATTQGRAIVVLDDTTPTVLTRTIQFALFAVLIRWTFTGQCRDLRCIADRLRRRARVRPTLTRK